jgi:hypothetical protein
MDKELIAYFDVHFREFAQKISEETAQQFTAFREETAQQFTAFREETAQQFAASREETAQQVAKLREEMISRFEKGEETARQNFILVEDLRHQVHLVAEVVIGMNERLERYQHEAVISFDRIIGLIEPYYRDLDSRVSLVDGRVRILEGRAERQQGDVMDAIRKMLGKPPLSPPATSE